METESKNVTNFCHVKKGLLIKKYKTTWIPLRAEEGEEQEKNEDHPSYQPILLL